VLICILITPFFDAYCQKFIVLDQDTQEVIDSVNYKLSINSKTILNEITELKTFNAIDQSIVFDTICFYKNEYFTKKLCRSAIDSIIYLEKKTINLEEIVIKNPKNAGTILGEINRTFKSQSRQIPDEIIFGTLFTNDKSHPIQINEIWVTIEKVKVKTEFQFYFYKAEEITPRLGRQFLSKLHIDFKTDKIILSPGQKGLIKNKIELPFVLAAGEKIFVAPIVLKYVNEDNTTFTPSFDQTTKIKFQLSNKENFYSKMIYAPFGNLSKDFVNINSLLKYDFTNSFKKTPHKSTFIAPAIVLFGVLAD
jgi:hypothetical protein